MTFFLFQNYPNQKQQHATALGYETSRAMVEAMFQGMTKQDPSGIQLVLHDNDELYLKAPISKYLALKKTDQMTVIQVTADPEEPGTMKHTGIIRRKRQDDSRRFYEFLPLSAALRVSQREDVETGNIQNGSIHPAVLFAFDSQGDGGSPLLTLSLNPSRQKVVKQKLSRKRNDKDGVAPKYTPVKNPRHLLDNLNIGQGPYNAKIIRTGEDHALVDFGVGRKYQTGGKEEKLVGSSQYVKVYGMLRFKDAVNTERTGQDNVPISKKGQPTKRGKRSGLENVDDILQKAEGQMDDDEQVEDITHLFELNEDGELTYKNPETGQIEVMQASDDDEEGEDSEDEPISFLDDASPSQQRRKTSKMRLKVGEKVPVYILSVPKHMNQVMVTTDLSLVQGKKPKDIKREGDVSKKLERLSQLLGGLSRAEELKGKEYDGTVKATSQSGNWLYVQPENDENLNLPVGVATLSPDPPSFAQGDRVRIRMEGIDQARGQLAMHVLEKLSP